MRIEPIELERGRGLVSGYLPITTLDLERQAARQYDGYRLQFEGRSRVNDAEGYQIAFNAQLRQPGRSPRQLLGRIVVLPEPYDPGEPEKPYPEGEGPTRGLLVTLLATTLDEVSEAQNVGDTGILKKPFRSLRFD
jgi:hypothetical protein